MSQAGSESGRETDRLHCLRHRQRLGPLDPRNLYRRMGYADATTDSIVAEIGLREINHRMLDAGEPFGATLGRLAARFPQHAEFIRAFDARWVEMLGGAIGPSVEILQALKRSGVPVHAISNYNREKFDVA